MLVTILLAALLGQAQGLRKAVVQESVQNGRAAAGSAVAWVAGPWGDCARRCGPAKFRTVECRAVYSGETVEEGACKGPKPGNSRSCVCDGEELCTAYESSTAGCPAHSGGGGGTSLAVEEVGCFATPPQPAHVPPAPGSKPLPFSESPYTTACLEWKGDGKCAGGLPFYELAGKDSMEACAEFCLAKRLDIFGLGSDGVCRCGASKVNKAIWTTDSRHSNLAFEPEALARDAGCALKVSRYAGFYEDGGIPKHNWKFKVWDTQYTDSIASGFLVAADREGHLMEANMLKAEVDAAAGSLARGEAEVDAANMLKAGPTWDTRKCYPESCFPGIPWTGRTWEPLPGKPDKYQYYTRIPFAFDSDVDQDRKDAFRDAAKTWSDNTCINFVESEHLWWPYSYIRVGIFNKEECSVDIAGKGRSKLNLGFCNNKARVGDILHELGHAIGMAHEIKRADGRFKYHGKGPHVYIDKEKVAGGWYGQYAANYQAYMGSVNDGPGDPHTGYAPYDFASIMHYSQPDLIYTIPESAKSLLGSTVLSKGDISEVNDMYQCRICKYTDTPGFKDAHGFTCDDWRGLGCNFAYWYSYSASQLMEVQRNCKKACGFCDGIPGTP